MMRSALVGRVLLSMLGTASAQPAAVPVNPTAGTPDHYALAWVRDEGAEACPNERELEGDVTRRLGRSPFDDTAERSIEIRVERSATRFSSRVLVRGKDGGVLGKRMLTSNEPTCDALFSATALAVALLIDPDATTRPTTASPSAVATFEEPVTPAEPPRAESSPPVAPPRPSGALPPTPTTPVAPDRVQGSPERTEGAWVAAAGLLALGLVPGTTAGAALQVAGQPHPRWGWSALAFYAAPATRATTGAAFQVGLTALGAAVSFRPLPGAPLFFEVGPYVGARRATVTLQPGRSNVVPAERGDLPFVALGGAASAQLPISNRVFVLSRAGVVLPLLRHRLGTRSNDGAVEEAWLEPPLAGLFCVGLGHSFF